MRRPPSLDEADTPFDTLKEFPRHLVAHDMSLALVKFLSCRSLVNANHSDSNRPCAVCEPLVDHVQKRETKDDKGGLITLCRLIILDRHRWHRHIFVLEPLAQSPQQHPEYPNRLFGTSETKASYSLAIGQRR